MNIAVKSLAGIVLILGFVIMSWCWLFYDPNTHFVQSPIKHVAENDIRIAVQVIDDIHDRHSQVVDRDRNDSVIKQWVAVKESVKETLQWPRQLAKMVDNSSAGVQQGPLRYAVIGCKIPTNKADTYSFYLPLTVRAWKRLGYGTVVILAGNIDLWNTEPILQYIQSELHILGAIVVSLQADEIQNVMLSQVSRLFAASLTDWLGKDNTFLLTSDADLWPLDRSFYTIQPDKRILILNSECCGNFFHKGVPYKMYPLSNIGMSVQLWREVMQVRANLTPEDIVDYFYQEVGDIAKRPVHKGMNDGWFMDQKVVSVRLEQWAIHHNRSSMQLVNRNGALDRIDRSMWSIPESLSGKRDSHLLLDGYSDSWHRLLPLIKLMYSEEEVAECQKYRDHYLEFIS